MVIAYTTRERVKNAFDVAETQRANAQIDDAIRSATETVDALCHRSFAPWLGTRWFDYPDQTQRYESFRLWLNDNDLIRLDSLTAGGSSVALSSLKLRPANAAAKRRPYTHVELDLSSGDSAFDTGDTFQDNIVITGLWGYTDTAVACGALAATLDATTTTVDVTDGSAVGVGSLLRIDDERFDVTDRDWLVTGVTLTTPLTAAMSDDLLVVSNGAALHRGEQIRIDTEAMRILSISGNDVTVRRDVDGTTLATHAAAATIDADRRLTVERGVQGTTAAAHSLAGVASCWKVPRLVDAYATAVAIDQLGLERSGYAREAGSGDNRQPENDGTGLGKAREACWSAHGRKVRHRAVA